MADAPYLISPGSLPLNPMMTAIFRASLPVGNRVYHLGTNINTADVIIEITTPTSAIPLQLITVSKVYTGAENNDPIGCLSLTAIGVSRLILGCKTRLVVVDLNSDGSISAGAFTSYSIGTGDYQALYYHSAMNLLYAGTSNGFSFALTYDPTQNVAFRIRKVLFSNFGSAPVSCVFVDEDPNGVFPRSPVIFWGTHTGALYRTDANATEFVITSSGQVPTNLAITQMSKLERDYLYLATSLPTSTSMGNIPTSLSLAKAKKVDCSAYSCSQCMQDPYCGWCYSSGSSGSCTQPDACPSAEYSFTTGTCPVLQYISPTSGSVTGGTSVTVYGAYFRPSSQYHCRWSVTPSGSSTTPYISSASFVASSHIICITPPVPPAPGYSVVLDILYTASTGSQYNWISGISEYKYYNCSTLPCDSCTTYTATSATSRNIGDFKECGWCVMSSTCSTNATCVAPNGTLALVSSALGWTRSPTPCPATTSAVPSTVSILSTQPVAINVTNFPATSASTGAFNCRFTLQSSASTSLTSAATGVTNSSNSRYFSSFRCPIPSTAEASFGSTSSVYVTIETASTTPSAPANSRVSVGTGAPLDIYSCDDFTRCDACTTPSHPECVWCASTRTCAYNTLTTCPHATSCPTVSAVSPNSTQIYSSKALSITLSGSLLSDATPAQCRFDSLSSSDTFYTTAVINSPTSVSCATPTDASFTTGLWDVSIASSQVSLMEPKTFNVYDCSVLDSCHDCVTEATPECNWCSEPSRVTCSNSTSSTCSRRISLSSGNSTCPILNTVDPTYVVISKAHDVRLSGTGFDLTSTSAPELHCAITLDNQIFTTDVTYVDESTVNCESVNIGSLGTADILLRDNTTNEAFSTASTLGVQNCSSITNCTQCISYGCVLCWGSCADACSDPAGQQLVCPVVASITPTYADIENPVTVTIYGSNFIADSEANSKRYYEEEIDESVTSILAQMQREAVETGSDIAISYGSSLERGNSYSHQRRQTVASYQCYFGTQVTPGTWKSSSSIECQSPSGGVDREVALVVYIAGVPYFTAQATYDLFACPNTIQTDTCYSDCTANTHCGWCPSTQSCSSETVCQAPAIWQSTCNVPELSKNLSGIDGGGTPLLVNMSSPLPAYTARDQLVCAFGSATAPITNFYPNTSELGTEISAVECIVPPSPDISGATVPFAVTYQNNRVTTASTFIYVECSQFKSCTKCSVQRGCGWCRVNNKCTMESQCAAGRWTTTNCPVSPLALGLGIGLGLLFLIVLGCLIAYLIYRGNRKRGLLIRMREPDYDAIAWGIDHQLQFRIPAHKYGVLERALCRKDHLLQLALSLTCPATEQEMLAKGLVFVAVYHDFAPEMIQTVIRAEVTACLEENTLFRSNSVASKMYKFYSRIVGIKYLYHCIARVIMELEVLGQKSIAADAKDPEDKEKDSANAVSLLNVTMELDTQMDFVTEGTIDTDTNLLQLQLICQKILTVLTKKTLRDIPAPLRRIFIEIDRSVSQKFPGSIDAVYKGLGGLFFLRFVCPAITAPHVYGLLERPPNEATQRQLVLIGKVIQSIANMSPPGRKEPYMEVMGGFINSSIPRIKEFYDNLRQAANVDNGMKVYDRDIVVPENILLNGLAATQVVLAREHDKIKAWAQTSHLHEDLQKELCQIIDDCMAEDDVAPKKVKKEQAASSKKKR